MTTTTTTQGPTLRAPGSLVRQSEGGLVTSGPEDDAERVVNREEPARARGNFTSRQNSGKNIARSQRLSIASLNICGLAQDGKKKLPQVWSLMRQEQWGVIALQETHESEEAAAELQRNGRCYTFANPGNQHSRGTMFILDKSKLRGVKLKADIKHEILIEGRASLLRLPWDGQEIRIVNVYAPNIIAQAEKFFVDLREALRGRLPHIMLGDFNHVELEIDKFPVRLSSMTAATTALRNLREACSLWDGWRLENEGTRQYTWTREGRVNNDGTVSRSRLDRILVKSEMLSRAMKWGQVSSGKLSDHEAVFFEIRTRNPPAMGKGRWRMTLEDLRDPQVIKDTTNILRTCEALMTFNNGMSDMDCWIMAKEKVQQVCVAAAHSRAIKRGAHVKGLQKLRKGAAKAPDFETNRSAQITLLGADRRLKEIQDEAMKVRQDFIAARYAVQGERVNKYWLSMNKSFMDETVIHALKDKDGQTQSSTHTMVEVAEDYHRNLQAGLSMTEEREQVIEETLRNIDGVKLTEREAEILETPITVQKVVQAIRKASGGKAPGKDGIIYEFYKVFLDLKGDQNDETFPRIENILTKVFLEVETTGTAPKEFVEGAMFLMHKKKDKDRIENYRPITLLNTDYKLMTKVYASKLGETLLGVIHRDQAGFVPGRHILDQIETVNMIMEYCEVTQKAGNIVALDQEKAYDRIDHEYLWRVMRFYGLPQRFINTIKALYREAETTVVVNKMFSTPYEVARGVRQGDPLSCLLFNLAIEPLAESLRRSTLRGIRIPGAAERIVCKLFADDTLLYLARSDRMSKVRQITGKWCLASGAKFNEDKTEILPVGPRAHRDGVVSANSLQGKPTSTEKLDEGVKVVKNGEAMRVLGGWVGHNIDQEAVWNPVIQKAEQAAKAWAKTRLTFKGRKIILNTLVLARTQYMMMTNDPPKVTVKRVEKIVHSFMWDGKRAGNISMAKVHQPIDEGGLNLPKFEWKVDAGRIMRAKKWNSEPEIRPIWADILNESIRVRTEGPKSHKLLTLKTNILHQDWAQPKRLPPRSKDMIKTAFKYGIRVDAPKLSQKSKEELPAWFSKALTGPMDVRNQDVWRAKRYHGVMSVRDLVRLQQTPPGACPSHHLCLEMARNILNQTKVKFNPVLTTPVLRGAPRDDLDHTERRTRAKLEAWRAGGEILLDPNITHMSSVWNATRIFTNRGVVELPAIRPSVPSVGARVEIWTDGSADHNGFKNSKCGAGLWSEDPAFVKSYRVPGYPQSNNRGEIAAVAYALTLTPMNREVILMTDSMYVVDGLVQNHVRWEDSGWLDIENADLWITSLARIRARTAKTFVQKVKAHADIHGNEMADQMAKNAVEKDTEDELPPLPSDGWRFNGARLSSLTFNEAYRWVRAKAPRPVVSGVNRIPGQVAEVIEAKFGNLPYQKKVWESIWSKPIRREVSSFLWLAMHGRNTTGLYFMGWPGWEDEMYCECGALETLQHIFEGCVERQWVWQMWDQMHRTILIAHVTKGYIEEKKQARRMLQQIGEDDGAPIFPTPTYYEILGVGLWKYRDKLMNTLMKTIVSETAFAIWKLRCKRVIEDRVITPGHAVSYWNYQLMSRAKLDRTSTYLKSFASEKERLSLEEQKAVWTGILDWDAQTRKLRWSPSDFG